jgi:AraC family transcriptional regulator of adaptative response/methylated-DNA-[protein]-cysteine methyltransferase
MDHMEIHMSTDQKRWQAVVSRDAGQNGKFWYGVITTGVYCRPSCAARRAKPQNVRFFDSIEAAKQSGLRACKRCRPDEAAAGGSLETLLRLCRFIETHAQQAHTLTILAARSGLSQFQVHRLFKAFLQLTPKEYIEQVRLRAFKRSLRSSANVTDAIYEAGFESSSAVYGRMDAHLGMTPRDYRAGGAGVSLSFAFGRTHLGLVLIGASDRGVCYVQFGESERQLLEQLHEEYPRASVSPSSATAGAEFSAWMKALNARIEGARAAKALPLDVQGTAFQKRVWDFLQSIPRGSVASYQEVAEAIGSPRAHRAVANACANNKIGVLVPCHRVIRGDGSLGGYRWGLARKRALLDAERKPSAKREDLE